MRTTIPLRALTLAAVAVLAVVGLGFGDEPAKPKVEAKSVAVTKKDEKALNRIFFHRAGGLYSLAPDGTDERRIDFQAMNDSSQPSPDGKTAATWDQWLRGETEHAFLAFADRTSRAKPLRALAKLPKHLSRHFCWSPDGSHVHVSQRSAKVPGVVEHCIVDAKTQAVTPLDILRDHVVMDCSRDGKTFLTLKVAGDGAWAWKSLHLMNADGTEVRTIAVADRSCRGMALSPDGTRALSVIDGKLAVVDATKLRPPAFVAGAPAGDGVRVAAWSPDGRRIAYTTSPVPMEGLDPDEQESRLVVADPSGQNATVLRAVKGESFGYVFWR